MEILIHITDAIYEEILDLNAWLVNEDELRGRCRIQPTPIGGTELGSISQVLTVALGTGGAGTILASSIITWLQTRRTKAKLTISTKNRSVSIDIETIHDVEPLLRQLLTLSDYDRDI